MTLTLADIPVRGASLGSFGTCIQLPSMKLVGLLELCAANPHRDRCTTTIG